MDGKRAYTWLFANDDFKVFLFRESRGSKVPKSVLGEEELMLILITDRYCGYSPLLVQRQLCCRLIWFLPKGGQTDYKEFLIK
jgi:Transposase IS66 family